MMTCEDLPTERLQQICRGESELPVWKANTYRAQFGIESLPDDGEITYVIHDGKADIPIPVHQPVINGIARPAAGRCASCDTPKPIRVIEIGPGAELTAIMTSLGLPHCQDCKDQAKEMNAWGVVECRERMTEIVDKIMPRAKKWVQDNRPWVHAMFPIIKDIEIRRRVTGYVTAAIDTAERKQDLRDRVFRPLPEPVPVATVQDVIDQCQVVVKSFRRFDCLRRFLDSLWQFYPGIEVLIADDSLNHGESYPQFVHRIQDNPLVTWIQLPFDSGLSYGRNQCVNIASKPYIVLCDDDYLITENTRIERMLSVLQESPAISLVAGMIEEDRRVRNWVGTYMIANNSLRVSRLKEKFRTAGGVSYRRTDVAWNFFVARTESLKRIPWDNELKIAAEHVDFFISRFRAGEKSAYTPESCVRHLKTRTEKYNGFRERKDKFQAIMRKNQNLTSVQSLAPQIEAFKK